MVVSVDRSLRWAIKTAIKIITASTRTSEKRSEINDREDRVSYNLSLPSEFTMKKNSYYMASCKSNHLNTVPKVLIKTCIIS